MCVVKWSRRRHQRARRQLRRVVEQFVQSKACPDYVAKTRLEKLASLEAFCRRLRVGGGGGLLLEWLPADLQRRVFKFALVGMEKRRARVPVERYSFYNSYTERTRS